MKKKFILPLVAVALGCLSGCNKTEDTTNVVEFWHTFGAKTEEAIKTLASRFEAMMKERGVDVKIKPSYQGGYDDINRKIREGLAVGNTPTMAIAYPDHVADYLYEGNGKYVYNLENYFTDENIGFGKQPYLGEVSSSEDFVETFLSEGTQFTKEGTYTLPFMKSTEALFYNKQLLVPAYRLVKQEPEASQTTVENWIKTVSWEDFMVFCEAAAGKMSQIGNALTEILFYDSDANLLISKMYQEGIAYSSIENGKGKVDFEDPEEKQDLIDYVTELKRLKDAKALTTKGVVNKYGSDHFTKYQCLFTVGSTGGTGYNDPGSAFTPGVCKVPASKNNPLYVSQGPTLTFLKNTKYSDEVNDHKMELAWQFAKYITSPDQNTYMCIYGSEGYLPVTYNAYETANFSEFLEDDGLPSQTYSMIINEINGAYLNSPVFPGSATLRDEIEGIVKSSLTGQKTPTNAINDAISNTKLVIK